MAKKKVAQEPCMFCHASPCECSPPDTEKLEKPDDRDRT